MDKMPAYYATHSSITEPGLYTHLYDDLPDDLEELFRIINGVLLHKLDADDQYQPTAVQRKEQFLRTMRQRLARLVELDPSPLTVPRVIKEQQIGYCRDCAIFDVHPASQGLCGAHPSGVWRILCPKSTLQRRPLGHRALGCRTSQVALDRRRHRQRRPECNRRTHF